MPDGCPQCHGPTEYDRSDPPNPYYCEDCMTRTDEPTRKMSDIDIALEEYKTRQCSNYDGKKQSLRDQLLAEVLRLRAANAEMRGELIDCWGEALDPHSIGLNTWLTPHSRSAEHAAAQLHKLGIVEKHPDHEAYRFVQKGGE